MALGLTQPLTEMSTRNISMGGGAWEGKGGRCVGLTTLSPSCADCLEIWDPQSMSRPVMGLLYLFLDRDVWSDSGSGRFVSGKEPRESLKRGWFGSKIGLGALQKTVCPCRESHHRTSVVKYVARPRHRLCCQSLSICSVSDG